MKCKYYRTNDCPIECEDMNPKNCGLLQKTEMYRLNYRESLTPAQYLPILADTLDEHSKTLILRLCVDSSK